ncbi:twin-arginine translocase subunit TatC [Tepidanaerobacter sp. GT38]|uniref:twin-arginine translocase subunit TatC n=1 Tax=Tepidanaerobacter sp. GT38 TaxID=2722793 RepID=UPI001F01B643|nr:twin-arginine translocase subunit TatC [Tepidanaerobacter sp. GT38]MCG1012746.1 twin-arginine translocase subunit TatC [Tepidanaerobacter sp. GT38]
MKDKKLPLSMHLKELRLRLLMSLISVLIFAFISFIYWQKIISIIWSKDINLIYISPQEAFLTRIKVSFICGILLSVPVTLYQAWEFIKPALTESEQKITLVLGTVSTILFFLAVYFNVFIVTPKITNFFLKSAQPVLTPLISISSYTSFLLNMTIAFAFISQFPLLMVLGSTLGIVDSKVFIRNRRLIIIFIFTLAAIITPPDALSQLVLAVPMWGLYEFGLVLIKLLGKIDKKKQVKPVEGGL